MKSDDFADQYKHPKWQKARLNTLERDDYTCQHCQSKENELHVHHLNYKRGHKVWEYKCSELVTLCKTCHEETTKVIESIRAHCEDGNFVKGLRFLCACTDARHGLFVPAILKYLSLRPDMIWPIFEMLKMQSELQKDQENASKTP